MKMLHTKEKADSYFKICSKLIACCVTFIAILSTGIVSKGAIFFMISSMSNEWTQPSSGERVQDPDPYKHVVRFACWMWSLFFSFAVPELFGFLQSLHICVSRRGCWTRPRFVDFTIVFLFETAQAIGMALLLGSVFTGLSVLHGILITNCLYLVPALFNFLSRKPDEPKRAAKMATDAFAFFAQLSGCLHWTFIRDTTALLSNSYDFSFIQRQRMLDWTLPVSLILISIGWWENHVDKGAPVGFIKFLGRIKENMKETRPFTQIFVSLWKLLVFVGTMLILADVIFMTQEEHAFGATSDLFLLAIKNGFIQFGNSLTSVDWTSPFYVFIIQSTASFFFYCFGTFACKIGVQRSCFALPVVLITPSFICMWAVTQFDLLNSCHDCLSTDAQYFTNENYQRTVILLCLAFVWFLSQIWITLHIWKPAEISEQSETTDTKWYNSFVIDQSMSLSPHYHPSTAIDETGSAAKTVFAVVTMWHESTEEIHNILKSIFRMDKDQCKRRVASDYDQVIDPHLYRYETHIFYDDAFEWDSRDGVASRVVNHFVNDFIAKLHSMNCTSLDPPTISPTPYGGCITWILPGKTKMAVHLKDKTKIRSKKRWSQLMYIEYLIRHEMANCIDLSNVFLLSLDGDMDFRAKSVHILVDLMNAQRDVVIACNRSHPTGSAGAIVWYQMFEYAIGFWLLKPSEDLLGSILCAPGCFSLIRANVLLDEEIMTKFNALSEKAHHMIQRDQGEDRWLCTLLIKRGYRLAYSASSYAYTHCPETFEEFYNQRRRWVLSIMANTIDVFLNCRQIVKMNPNISWLYIVFQAVLLTLGLLCPGSIFLGLVNMSAITFLLNPWISLASHSVLILIFIVTCFLAPTRVQLMVAKCLSALYGLILGIVGINSAVSISGYASVESYWSIHNVFFLSLVCCIFLMACLHLNEIHCLLAGPIYMLLTPSMSMLLFFYAIINMNVVSWGTRDSNSTERATPPTTETLKKDIENYSNIGNNYNETADGADTVPQISNENGQTFNTTHELSIDTTSYQSWEMEQDAEDSAVPSSSIPADQNPYKTRDSLNWNLETEVELSKQLSNVKCLSDEENSYWNNLIAQKLFPVVDSNKEHKERISIDLIRLRNLSFTLFISINSLFVALLFGMQVNSDISILQGLNNTNSSSYNDTLEFTKFNDDWVSQTNPMHIVLVVLAGLMIAIQFVALLISRTKNLIRLLSSVELKFFRKNLASADGANGLRLSNKVVLIRFNSAANRNEKNSASNHQTDLGQISTISQL
ncbi:chitin synthase chs-2 [Daphnia magna]|uniref:chitin synthase chs-2 n=1 Tax=Daphnia magna TaxID=35525 RepID=UPI001E1BAEF5|nr:chitin synthase chs-2 [Daphnia magna]XP_045030148.1 chitin synthase chs-2 [Daphnia magna]XP_045030149.1 chitin synthase chs-2 [Daphnia magna]XP_045030150.1 chitin synthase chs-2 [Daphnia magna]XP_045030151.1 chitin synthase chs-2 [Daphnia magna]XP_045030152.1 chitin synthase chs-2 [Daphnia magna]XP_045030153.1 chitin synthase chs-2 [Daphnia magna]XP_045030155.1 chitin synthase chs-2 [Daphnia magna]XP_045030156.1 chitin synthase chs-2 [Daphnia magna]